MKQWMAAVAILIAPVVLVAQKVNTDSDPAANFSSYKTYAWTAGTPAADPLAQDRIHDAVEQQLAGRGFTPSSNPDVYVATLVATQERQQLIADGFGGGFLWGGPLATATVRTYTVGSIVVDMYDAHTKQLVWRGTGSDTMSSKSEKNTQKIDKAVAKMFERYPGQ